MTTFERKMALVSVDAERRMLPKEYQIWVRLPGSSVWKKHGKPTREWGKAKQDYLECLRDSAAGVEWDVRRGDTSVGPVAVSA